MFYLAPFLEDGCFLKQEVSSVRSTFVVVGRSLEVIGLPSFSPVLRSVILRWSTAQVLTSLGFTQLCCVWLVIQDAEGKYGTQPWRYVCYCVTLSPAGLRLTIIMTTKVRYTWSGGNSVQKHTQAVIELFMVKQHAERSTYYN